MIAWQMKSKDVCACESAFFSNCRRLWEMGEMAPVKDRDAMQFIAGRRRCVLPVKQGYFCACHNLQANRSIDRYLQLIVEHSSMFWVCIHVPI
jgi:hypothetical protein